MRVQFKFSEASPRRERDEPIQTIRQQGAYRVEPLFKREADPEFALRFVLGKLDGVGDPWSHR